ncbi:transposase [Streptomyces sp. NPDC007157]|uniref:transposase n=1 Tax=Streptomyces sp. NPDC007157 TaxID=3154681 RepID=UPI003403CD0F
MILAPESPARPPPDLPDLQPRTSSVQRPDHPRERPPQQGTADQPAAWGVLRFLLGGAARAPPARALLCDHRIVGLAVPLTDAQWAQIEPLLPDRTPRRDGRWRDHRQVIDAIAWKFQTGSQWVYLPAKYGSWKGVYTRLRNYLGGGRRTSEVEGAVEEDGERVAVLDLGPAARTAGSTPAAGIRAGDGRDRRTPGRGRRPW